MPEKGKDLLVFDPLQEPLAETFRACRESCSGYPQRQYFCAVNNVLNNPVWGALTSGDKELSFGTETVKFFDETVSPFAGFAQDYDGGFDELHALLPPGRTILYAVPYSIEPPNGWQLLHGIPGLQFVYEGPTGTEPVPSNLVPLGEEHIAQMVELATLTKPGPFGPRTIDFGYYYGIFEGDRLVAMTGQRLHVHQFSEISAVCTHPDHLGKGYAAALVQQALHLILQQGQTPFLHVRADNSRAIALYERLGFTVRGQMNFYVLKRSS